MGSEHVERGTLVAAGHLYFLVREDGGRWRLDVYPHRVDHLLGRKVALTGRRAEFDLLEVIRIEAIDPA